VLVPVWLTLGFAILVIAYGSYRIWLATRPRAANKEAARHGGMLGGGFYRMRPRTHLLVGSILLVLGACLLATSFGWNPFGGAIEPSTAKPGKDGSPSTIRVPIDRLPPPKPDMK
jgi:hypothetical protein